MPLSARTPRCVLMRLQSPPHPTLNPLQPNPALKQVRSDGRPDTFPRRQGWRRSAHGRCVRGHARGVGASASGAQRAGARGGGAPSGRAAAAAAAAGGARRSCQRRHQQGGKGGVARCERALLNAESAGSVCYNSVSEYNDNCTHGIDRQHGMGVQCR
eukprot:365043-Chlamydomonas_euryale.AAC.6